MTRLTFHSRLRVMRAIPRTPIWAVLVAAIAVLATVLPFGPAHSSSSAKAGATGSNPVGAPLTPADGTAYIGAFVDPSGQGLSGPTKGDSVGYPTGDVSTLAAELASSDISNLDSGLSRPMGIFSTYQTWQEVKGNNVSPAAQEDLNTQLATIFANGSYPLINWLCDGFNGGNNNDFVDTVNAPNSPDDTTFTDFADQLKASGVPVLLDWAPDANNTQTENSSCLPAGAKESVQGSDYAKAYDHIQHLFATAGATNVSFVWSVDTSVGKASDWQDFYPGASAVNWIAGQNLDSSAAPSFTTDFSSWYQAFAGAGKPMMVTTGVTGTAQSSYISSIPTSLSSSFPKVKAVVYFDSPYKGATESDYQLTTSGTGALDAASDKAVFLPGRATPTISVSSDPPVIQLGQVVKLEAAINGSDQGGAIKFEDGGTVITGCAAVPAFETPTCETSSLPEGSNAITATYLGDAAYAQAASDSYTLSVSTHLRTVGQPAIPDQSAYIGGWVQPKTITELGDVSAVKEELTQLPSFNQSLEPYRPLSIIHVYQGWVNPAPLDQIRQVIGDGGTPMLDWRCYDSDANVIAGNDDPLIKQEAENLASLGTPIFLRWYWEPNFNQPKYVKVNGVEQPDNNAARCLLPGVTGIPTPAQAAQGAADYVAAYQHIYQIFQQEHATNVAFVWAISSADQGTDRDMLRYFPGSNSVDWIAVDGYDRCPTWPNGPGQPTSGNACPTNDNNAFAGSFDVWYSYFSSYGLPMMIAEAGAVQGATSDYLAWVKTHLSTDYPQIKAFVYFDADRDGRFNYTLTPANGLDAFRAMDADPYFQPKRQPSAFTLSSITSPSSPVAGQETQITATFSTYNDAGGSLALYDNLSSTPLPGCADVSLTPASIALTDPQPISCETDGLVAGNNSIVAHYTGDPAFAPFTSLPVTIVVGTNTMVNRPDAPRPPASGAYLGAWINPKDNLGANLATFNKSIGRPLSVVSVYQGWKNPAPLWELRDITNTGAIPLINWNCDDSDANVSSGADDALINSFAQELAELKAPVFLRWGADPNLTTSAAWRAAPTAADPQLGTCLGSAGPQGYQAAFEHIHDQLITDGATNVSFVWSLSLAGDFADPMAYYPGSAYVDWIAADGYPPLPTVKHPHVPNAGDSTVPSDVFGPWYNLFDPLGKPLMISETAAPVNFQAAYLSYLTDALSTSFPDVKAVVYFDGTSFSNSENYGLDSAGLSKFQEEANSTYYQPSVQPSATALSGPATAVGDSLVTISATVSPTDYGGSVAFTDSATGQAIPDCQSVPVAVGTCSTRDLAVGNHTITATYTGDTQYGPSLAPAVAVTVTPGPPATTTPTTVPGSGPTAAGTGAVLTVPSWNPTSYSGLPTIGALNVSGPGGAGLAFTPSAPDELAGSPLTSIKPSAYAIEPAGFVKKSSGYGMVAVSLAFVALGWIGIFVAYSLIADFRRKRQGVA